MGEDRQGVGLQEARFNYLSGGNLMADTRARAKFSDSNDPVPTASQLSGMSALIIKADTAALNNFAPKVQAAADAGIAAGMFWEAEMFFYPDQGFSPSDKAKWTPAANDPQFKLMDRFVNNHAVQFAIVDFAVTSRMEGNTEKYLDGIWLFASGQHILDVMKVRYPKLKKIYLYIKKDTIEQYSGSAKDAVVQFVMGNKDKFPLAFLDFETTPASGLRPKLPWDDGNQWHWWLAANPFVFIYAWNQVSLYSNIGFIPGVTPPVVDPPVVDPTVPPVIPGTLEAKVDWIIAKLNQHYK
jgi:hypothetical protein